MDKEGEEKNHNTLLESPTLQQPKRHRREIFAREWSCAIDIPLDLTVEILKKLPAKSLVRFRCVSKQWSSIISKRRDFIDSIVARSSSQPQRPYFILQICPKSEAFFVFTSTYPSQLARAVPSFKISNNHNRYQYVRGLIGCWSLHHEPFTIHNPTTRKSVSLPTNIVLATYRIFFFGYDPIENQYKVLGLTTTYDQPEQYSCQVFTLGDPKKQWRNIQCGIGLHSPYRFKVICINGVIYYKASSKYGKTWSKGLVSFNIRSERFDYVQVPKLMIDTMDLTFINYQGKLGCLCCNNLNKDVDMWVMNNVEKQEWSKVTFFSMLQGLPSYNRFPGVTSGGEIVIVHYTYCSGISIHVYYYDPKQNRRRIVEIETPKPEKLKRGDCVQIMAVVLDHVENTMSL